MLPGAGHFGSPYESSARLWQGGYVSHADFVLVEEGVLRERVVRDVGNPLESPFFGIPYFRGGAGNLRDVAHSWDDSLGIEVGPQGGGERGVGNEIGAFDELSEGVFQEAAEPPLGPIPSFILNCIRST